MTGKKHLKIKKKTAAAALAIFFAICGAATAGVSDLGGGNDRIRGIRKHRRDQGI